MSTLNQFQQQFIDFLVRCEVLTFGDFTTKSGRKTPYFVNTGRVRTGSQIDQFASFYARTIVEKIGEGGMGVVYRAHDERLDHFLAVP